jgi:hypothetical protein
MYFIFAQVAQHRSLLHVALHQVERMIRLRAAGQHSKCQNGNKNEWQHKQLRAMARANSFCCFYFKLFSAFKGSAIWLWICFISSGSMLA